jgi:hypothetical protein
MQMSKGEEAKSRVRFASNTGDVHKQVVINEFESDLLVGDARFDAQNHAEVRAEVLQHRRARLQHQLLRVTQHNLSAAQP